MRLAWVDGVHVYVGLVGGIFVAGKVARVGLRYRVPGVAGVIRWHRWVSWSLLVLYGVVFGTGVLALLPIHGRLYGNLVNLHLISSVWALAPTTWHVWHYRRRAAPFLTRLHPATGRLWLGVALAAIPAAMLLANARGASQLPQVGGGSSWSLAALNNDYLDRLAAAPDGSLVAAGDAVYVSRDGVVWLRLDLPAGSVAAPPASAETGSAPVHQHGPVPAGNAVLSLAVAKSGIYAGTKTGLDWSASPQTALTELGLDGQQVRALALDPNNERAIWAGTSSGLMFSADGGSTWSKQDAGIAKPASVAALAFHAGKLYASDGAGIYAWNGSAARWGRSAAVPGVVDLSPGNDKLYASSVTEGVWVLGGSTWSALASPAASHQHHGHLHGGLAQVTALNGVLYASGTSDGVSASADGGRTWTQLAGGLPGDSPPTDVIARGPSLLAASAYGLYQFPLSSSAAPGSTWWALLVAAAVFVGTVALLIGTPQRLRPLFGAERLPTELTT